MKKNPINTLSSIVQVAFRSQPAYLLYAAGLLAILILGISLGVTVLMKDLQLRTIILDVIPAFVDLLTSAALFIAAKNSSVRSKRLALAWGIMGLSMLFYAVGDIIWVILEDGLKIEPFPSIADVFYLAYFPVFLAGAFLLLEKPATRGETVKRTLDMAIVLGSALLIFWKLLIGPTMGSTAVQTSLEQGISLAYPVGDLVLLGALSLIILYPSEKQGMAPIFFLSGSLLTMIIGDGIFSYQSLAGTYVEGGLLDLSWIAGVLLAGLAGISQWVALRSTNISGKTPFLDRFLDRLKAIQPYAPYLWVVMVFIFLGSPNGNTTSSSTGLVPQSIGLAGIIVLVLTRQIIATYENDKLNTRLQKSMDRVQAQAAELGKTNLELQNDITERTLAEEALHQSEEKYRLLFENMVEGVYYQRADGVLFDANQSALAILGLTRDQFVGRTSDHPEWKVTREDGIALDGKKHPSMVALRTGKMVRDKVVGIYNPEKQDYVWMRVNAIPQFKPGEDKPYQTFVTLHDITAHRQAEETLTAERNLFRTLIDNLPDAVYAKDTQSRFLLGNAAVARVMGAATPNELIGKTDFDFFPEGLAKQYFTDEQAIIQSGKAEINREESIIYPDGSQGWVLTTQVPLRDQNGSVMGLVGIGRTITERKQAEEQLQLLKYSIDTAPDAAYWLDSEGRFIYVNETGCKTLGYAQVELMDMHVSMVNPRATPERWAKVWQELKEKGTINIESVHRRKDGSEFPVELTSVYVKFGEKEYCNGFAKDISERKRSETALTKTEKIFRQTITQTGSFPYQRNYGEEKYAFLGEGFERLTGYNPEEMTGALFNSRLRQIESYGDYKNLSHDERIRLAHQGEIKEWREDYVFERKDGALIWLADHAVPLFGDSGKVVGTLGILTDITERKQAEEAQQQSERLFRGLFELSPDAIVLIDPHDPNVSWPIVDCNTTACQMNGYRRDELIGQSIDILNVTPGKREERNVYMEQMRKAGILKYETSHRHKNGTIFPIELSTTLIKVGERELVIGIDRDATERKRSVEALRESEERYRNLFQNSLEGIGLSMGNKIIDANKALLDIFGYDDLAEFTQVPLLANVVLASQGLIREYLEKVNKGEPHDLKFTYQIFRKDRAVRDIEISVGHFKIGDDVYTLSTFRDITERKQAEEVLRENQARLDLALQSANMGVWHWDILENRRYFDGQTCHLLGLDPATFSGTPEEFFACVHPDDREIVKAALDRTVAQDVLYDVEYRILWPDKSLHYMAAHGVLVHDGTGQPVRINGLIWDITERKRAEEALAAERNLLSTLIDNLPDNIFIKDSDGRIVMDNSAHRRLLGVTTQEETMGKTDFDFFPQELAASYYADEQESIRLGEALINREELTVNPDGEQRWLLTTKVPLRDHQGMITGIVGINRDITERKRAELEMARQAEELARLYRASSSLLTESPFDLPALAHTILKIVLDEFGQSNCSLFLVENGSDKLTRAAALGQYTDQVSKVIYTLDGPGLVPNAIRAGNCINTRDVLTDPAYVPAWDLARSELTIPLKVGNQVIGAIDIQSALTGFFSVDDERMMTIFAERAALALAHARLYTQTERRLENLTALRVVDTAIASSFDVNFTLGILLDQVTKRLGIEAVNIMVFNPTSQTIQSSVAQGFRPGRLGQSSLRLGENLARQVVRERRTITIENLVSVNEEIPGVADLVRAGFTSYLGVPLIAKGFTKGVLEVYQSGPISLDEEQRTFLDMLAGQAAIAIDSAQLFENLQGSNVELMMAYDETIEGWSQALDLRDKETEGHSRRVTEMTVKLAASFGSTPEELIHIRRGALLHDIGKLGVPDEILRKPGPLTEEEWVIMRSHPQFAYEMLAPITYLHPALDIPFCHHEKWDGSGYPRGLKGNQIPLAARIFTVVDVWDALTSDRPYRDAWAREKALKYIHEQAGQHFDPGVVNAFFKEIPDYI